MGNRHRDIASAPRFARQQAALLGPVLFVRQGGQPWRIAMVVVLDGCARGGLRAAPAFLRLRMLLRHAA